ncbi:acetyl-CoA C-acetyltransferase [Pseudonocardia thermophila]|uniref:Acetyl-CoA C-acetyltransferase n=1 Tax=Pseudonocardia thermophila TaxID=1848 RepID=A0A1M6WR67_PSETH|nr:acetyl-CoA C-acyltransferase [Pseudonocardia thermophila]SHK96015.1 acetyl-CoA C-acetyltransferase [Pseudonocardia thermophila]
MTSAYIVAAARSAVGRRGKSLAAHHPADLAAHVLRETLSRAGVPDHAVDDVVLGCVVQVGAQSTNIARTVALSAGLPEKVPGTTVDRQCGSSQQALQFAAQGVLSGWQDVVVAGGVEVMSVVPMDAAIRLGVENGLRGPFDGDRFTKRYPGLEVSQFISAELIAERWNIGREEMERYSLTSHERALAAIRAGRFADEIVPVDGFAVDEGPRADTTLEAMAALRPLRPGGRLTAATSSQMSDGAAMLVVASDAAVERYGLTPLARIVAATTVGDGVEEMLTAPIPATRAVLERAGLKLSDIDTFEVNEAFASVPMAWARELGVDHAVLNPDGGAIALGHPLGATGARLMTTMLHRMRREGLRYGLQTMCEGGGMANATVVELVR